MSARYMPVLAKEPRGETERCFTRKFLEPAKGQEKSRVQKTSKKGGEEESCAQEALRFGF